VQEYPVAGGSFTYALATFGELPAWLTVGTLLQEYVLGVAAVSGVKSFSFHASARKYKYLDNSLTNQPTNNNNNNNISFWAPLQHTSGISFLQRIPGRSFWRPS
jgi:amino acid transporter